MQTQPALRTFAASARKEVAPAVFEWQERNQILAHLKQDLFPDGSLVIKGPIAAELGRATDKLPIFGMGCAKDKYLGACGFAERAISVMQSVQCPAYRSARWHGCIIPADDMVYLP